MSARPPLDQDEILSRYREVEDPIYLEEEAGRRRVFGWILEQMDGYWTPGRSLYEVGANVGLFLDEAGSRGWVARGIEPSEWAVTVGQERFGVDLTPGTVETLHLEHGSVDAVAMFDVLEHLTDPLGALRRLRDVVRDEGLLVLSTVNAESIHARLRRTSWPWFIRSHLFYFTPASLHDMLSASGFEMVEWTTVPRSFSLSYIAGRAAPQLGVAGRIAQEVATIIDPDLPMGWLGDIAMVVARPTAGAPPRTVSDWTGVR